MCGNRKVDERLAWLCHIEYEGGEESLEAEIEEMPPEELRRLLALAVIELMETRADAEREIERFMRRLNKSKGRPS